MVSIFKNSFFSVAGQKERLTNVVKTIGAAILPGGAKVVSTLEPKSTAGKVANKVLEVASANPFATAGVGAIAAKPTVAVAAAKEVVTKASNLVKKSPTTSAVGTATATTVAQKIVSPSNQVIPGQPAGSQVIVVPGQPVNPAPYVIPSVSPGGTPGSQDLGIGGGESASNVVSALNGKPKIINATNDLANYTGFETPTTMEQLVSGSPSQVSDFNSPTNSLTKYFKRQKLVSSPTTIKKMGKVRSSKSVQKKGKAKSRSKKRSRKAPYHKKGHFGSAKQFAKKGGFKVHTAKNGSKYIILKSGKARFVKK